MSLRKKQIRRKKERRYRERRSEGLPCPKSERGQESLPALPWGLQGEVSLLSLPPPISVYCPDFLRSVHPFPRLSVDVQTVKGSTSAASRRRRPSMSPVATTAVERLAEGS